MRIISPILCEDTCQAYLACTSSPRRESGPRLDMTTNTPPARSMWLHLYKVLVAPSSPFFEHNMVSRVPVKASQVSTEHQQQTQTQTQTQTSCLCSLPLSIITSKLASSKFMLQASSAWSAHQLHKYTYTHDQIYKSMRRWESLQENSASQANK